MPIFLVEGIVTAKENVTGTEIMRGNVSENARENAVIQGVGLGLQRSDLPAMETVRVAAVATAMNERGIETSVIIAILTADGRKNEEGSHHPNQS